MLVDEIMTTDVECVAEDAPLKVALERMLKCDVRHIPVVKGGEVIGILSDRDIRDYSLPLGSEFYERQSCRAQLTEPVSTLMSADPVTVELGTEITEVINVMLESKIGAVPVVEPGGLTLRGIISYEDILRAARALL